PYDRDSYDRSPYLLDSIEANSELGDQWEMVRGHQGEPRARQLHADDVDGAAIVDVIEMQHRQDAGVGPAPLQMRAQIEAVETLVQHARRRAAQPFVEVAEHDRRLGDAARVENLGQVRRLIATLEQRRAEVHVEQMQHARPDVEIDALAAARLAVAPRDV